ncbi:MAG: hypothetical protein AAF391_02010 [Bacteroidota bacterium]
MRALNLIAFLLFSFLLCAQDGRIVKIAGTNLSLQMPEGYSEISEVSGITNDTVVITFMEMTDISYYANMSDFDDIEAGYAEKGIRVQERYNGKLGKYDAIIILLDSEPQLSQVFFGDDSFSSIVQILGTPGIPFSTEAIIADLVTIQQSVSEISPLEEHALFQFSETVAKEWIFEKHSMSMFFFEHQEFKDVCIVTQLPGGVWLLLEPKGLAQQFLDKYKEQGNTITIFSEEEIEIADTPAYSVHFSLLTEDEAELEMKIIRLVTFGNGTGAFVFQLMGKENNENTMARFDRLMKGVLIK